MQKLFYNPNKAPTFTGWDFGGIMNNIEKLLSFCVVVITICGMFFTVFCCCVYYDYYKNAKLNNQNIGLKLEGTEYIMVCEEMSSFCKRYRLYKEKEVEVLKD